MDIDPELELRAFVFRKKMTCVAQVTNIMLNLRDQFSLSITKHVTLRFWQTTLKMY